MDPHLRGLALLYAANAAWALFFAAWGFGAAALLRVSGIVATFLAGPRILRLGAGPRFELGLLPFPSSSVRHELLEDEDDGVEPPASDLELQPDERPIIELPERDASPPIASVPFAESAFVGRTFALLSPYALLVLAVIGFAGPTALARVPGDAVLLVRGALSPLGTGTDLARGFLGRLGEVPPAQALGLGLGKQLAYLLLPLWSGLWSTLLFVARPEAARSSVGSRVATIGTLLGPGILGAWAVAIVHAVIR